MIQGFDVSVLVDGPILGNIGHAQLLTLIDEHRAALEAQESRKQLGRQGAILGVVTRKYTERGWSWFSR